MNRFAILLLTGLATAPVAAQAVPAVDSISESVDLWASVSLGAARSTTDDLIGAQLSLSIASGHLIGIARAAGVTAIDFSDNPKHRDLNDWALLIGARTGPAAGTTSIASGFATLTFDPGGSRRMEQPAIAFAAEQAFNVRYVGVGLTAFGAVATKHAYAALGLTLQLGKIR